MRRAGQSLGAPRLAVGWACLIALQGCEAILGTGSLQDRPDVDGAGGSQGLSDSGATEATASESTSSSTSVDAATEVGSTADGNDAAGVSAMDAEGSVGTPTPESGAAEGGVDAAADATMSSCGECIPNATRCVGNGVQGCNTLCQWSATVSACPSSTPSCFGGLCVQPASCAADLHGTEDCGPGGSGGESCCSSLLVAGGTFSRAYVNAGDGPTMTSDPATLSPFRLDKYLVTVGRFRQFVNAWSGGYMPVAGSGKHTHLNGGNGLNATGGGYEPGWLATDDANVAPTTANLDCSIHYNAWTDTAGDQESLPMNCVNWFEAFAFCAWDGGFLPSEAESVFAAAAGSQEREYPWGNADPGTDNLYAIYNCNEPSGSGTCTGLVNIAPVGTASMGAGIFGQLDLAGSAWEWNIDWYADAYVDPCNDCADLSVASTRAASGGSFSDPVSTLYSSARGFAAPADSLSNVGLRCARAP